MEENNKNDSTFKNICYYIFVLYMIFIADSLLFVLSDKIMLILIAKVFTLFLGSIFIIILLLHIKSNQLKFRYDLLALIVIITLIVISSILNFDSSARAPLKAATLIITYFAAIYLNKEKIIKYFVKIMIVIAVVSLLGIVFPDFFISLGIFPKIHTSSFNREFITLGLTNIPTTKYMQGRNWGPFWEPGAYQVFLNLAIFFVLFNLSKIKYKITATLLLSFTVLTTASTTGFIALPFFVIAYLINGKKSIRIEKKQKIIILISGIVILMIILQNQELLRAVIYQKFSETGEGSRFVSITAGTKLWLDNFVIGVGSQKLEEELISIAGRDFTMTNTVLAQLATYGTIVGGYFLLKTKGMIDSLKASNLSTVLLYFGFASLLAGQILNLSFMLNFLLFYRVDKYQINSNNMQIKCQKERVI